MIEQTEKILKIVSHYSKEQQVMQSIEEMSELTKELLKNINRGKNNIEEIKGEIADVMIMIMQLVVIYGTDEIDKIIEYKLDRQINRIKQEE